MSDLADIAQALKDPKFAMIWRQWQQTTAGGPGVSSSTKGTQHMLNTLDGANNSIGGLLRISFNTSLL
jgi:hypothetical protein